MKMKISLMALEDLLEIEGYFAGERIAEIADCCKRLLAYPRFGTRLSNRVSVSNDFRFLLTAYHVVFYKIADDFIVVYRILHVKSEGMNGIFKNEKPQRKYRLFRSYCPDR